MPQRCLVLGEIVPNVVHCLSVDPRTAVEAGSLALLLADNLAAAHAVVDQTVPCALAVACLPARHQELRNVSDLLGDRLDPLRLLGSRHGLLSLDLFIVAALVLNAVHEFLDELLVRRLRVVH
jgi:hypothetical protein